MRSSVITIIFVFFSLSIFQLLSCRKGTLAEGERFAELNISFPIITEDSLDIYVDGKLEKSQRNQGQLFPAIIFRYKDEITVSIHKKGDTKSLRDTVIQVRGDRLSLSFAYDPTLGFNRFVKPGDFVRPSADSIAFILINKYNNFGSGKINVTIYRNNSQDYTANPSDSVTTIKNLTLGSMSEKIILPAKMPDGTKNLYVIVVRDAVTGIDGNAEYIKDFGQPENAAYNFINADNAANAASGLINGVVISSLLYDSGSKIYNMPQTELAFQL